MYNKLNKAIMFLISVILVSCSSTNQIVYLNDYESHLQKDGSHLAFLASKEKFDIQSGDILKIDVKSIIPEAAVVYNNSEDNIIRQSSSLDMMILDGYRVEDNLSIKYPVLGKINVEGLSLNQLEQKITHLLIEGGHLKNPTIKISRLNSKFTVIGEVNNPGTFSYIDENINLLQAIGYAGDLTINGKRRNIILMRENKGKNKIYEINLTKSEIINKPYFYIKNNDVIIVEPNFSKVKSAGFIGSPASIASISSLLLSITLLIINK